MAEVSDPVIFTCWIAFIVYWLVNAQRVKTTVELQTPLSALAHRIPVGLGWWLMVYRKLPPPMNRIIIPRTEWALVIGTVVCVLGLLVTVWARRTLAGNWSSDVTFKQDHELVRTGPYQFARHPIYTGLLMMSLGTAIETGTVRCWLSIALVGIGFWIKLKQEERLLIRHFPGEYPEYQRQVKALVPFII